jgi:hypothetical protein
LILAALEVVLLEVGSGPDSWKPGRAKVFDTITRAWMVEAIKLMAESGIDLSHYMYLPIHCRHYEYLMVVFMRQGVSTQELILLNQCRIFMWVTTIADVALGDWKQQIRELFNLHPTENGDTAQCTIQPNPEK